MSPELFFLQIYVIPIFKLSNSNFRYSLIGKKETEDTNSYQANLAELSVTFYGGKTLVDEILSDECNITHVVSSGTWYLY